jgi:hypothetical protein
MCEEVPRQKAAESRKIPESGSVIPREGVESPRTRDGPEPIHGARDPERVIASGERLKIER